MKCPFCGKNKNHVLESRTLDEETEIRRRRLCEICNKRFTTYEKVKGSALFVIKKNGQREMFDKEKIKRGILKAIEKRPVSLSQIDEMIEKIERKMLSKEKEEVKTSEIGKMVLQLLKRKDTVAWIRFASVYLEFEDLADFEKVIWQKQKTETKTAT